MAMKIAAPLSTQDAKAIPVTAARTASARPIFARVEAEARDDVFMGIR